MYVNCDDNLCSFLKLFNRTQWNNFVAIYLRYCTMDWKGKRISTNEE